MSKSVWYRAAEKIGNGKLKTACYAIEQCSQDGEKIVNETRFERFFAQKYFYWWPLDEEGRLARTIALLLMDELEKDGQI